MNIKWIALRHFWTPLILLFQVVSFSAYSQIYITHVNLVDVLHQSIKADQTVLVNGDRIDSIASSSNLLPPDGSQVIDAKGKYLMPSMTAGQVQLASNGSLYCRPDIIRIPRKNASENELASERENFSDEARRYVSVGITSVFDIGSPDILPSELTPDKTKINGLKIYSAGSVLRISLPNSRKGFQDLTALEKDVPVQKVSQAILSLMASHPDFIIQQQGYPVACYGEELPVPFLGERNGVM